MIVSSPVSKRLRLLLLAFVLVANACAAAEEGTDRNARTEAVAPRGKLFNTSPEQFDRVVASSEGLPTVVNVWASWCIPCRAETPRFVKAAKTYESDVRFLGLDTSDDRELALDFIKEFKIPYLSGFDPKGRVARHLRVLGLPATFFFRPDGELAFVHNGEISTKDLDEKIKELIRVSASVKRDSRSK